MRVLAIGLGGAGSRIVDRLYGHDQRSRMNCVEALAVDVDSNTLVQLQHIPADARLYFPPIDPTSPESIEDTIHTEEIVAHIQKGHTIHIDAILICCGLGGSLVGAAQVIVGEVRKSFIEPVFAVVTMPCISEGERCSAEAADDLDLLQGITDAVILFDNETHYRKAQRGLYPYVEGESPKGEVHVANSRNLAYNPRALYELLNERISRQIGLLIRAGEFNEEGVEVAEVVLDAGEVLNTLRGSGLVAIGYASEQLPQSMSDFLDRWRSASHTIESNQKKAQRMVALAKRAVYEEMSVPCDLTSAEKALVLIAGPTQELSMRGFQTIRKWIDRSIAGLEMRSGDYPLRDTRFVGIIIVLSGLSNIPRVEEIRSIRTRYREAQSSARAAAEVRAREMGTVSHPVYTRGAAEESRNERVPVHDAAPAQPGRRRNPGIRQEISPIKELPPTVDLTKTGDDIPDSPKDSSEPDGAAENEPIKRTVDRRRRRGGDSGDGLTWIR